MNFKYRLEYKVKFNRKSYHSEGKGKMSDHYVDWLEEKLNEALKKSEDVVLDGVRASDLTYYMNEISEVFRKTKSIYRTDKDETAYDRSIQRAEKYVKLIQDSHLL